MKKELEEALAKKAMGYDTEEIVEEYKESDGEMLLVKRKVTRKNVPPDLAAIKLLMDAEGEKPVAQMTDEELAAEKRRLIGLLKEWEEQHGKEENGGTRVD